MNSPKVAIILVNWNTFSYSASCIKQLQGLSYPNYEVILVENGSQDGSGEKLKILFPELTFIHNQQNLGFTGGNNSGILEALDKDFDYILLLNNDTYFDANFLNPLVQFLELNPNSGAVQPLIYEKENPEKVWHAGGVFHPLKGSTKSIKQEVDRINPYTSEWLTGCAFMIRTSVVKKIGLLNPTFFAYFEDVDWSFKVKSLGLDLHIIPESVVYHEISGSTKAKKKGKEGVLSPLAHYLNIRNQLLLLKAHPKRINKYTAWPFQILKISAFFCYFILRLRFKKFSAAFDGLKHGLKQDPNSEKLPDISCYL